MSVLTRPNALWIYYPICWLAVGSVVLHSAFYDWYLLTPIDVGGTFMGGMGGQLFAIGWVAATVALLLALLVRMPGAIHACILAGVMPLAIGVWWQINYPDDAEQRIYSISPHEIGSAMLIGAVLLGLGLFLRSRLKKQGAPSLWAMIARSVMAIVIASVFIGVPIYIARQMSLPHCAFTKDGQQLTVCLSDDDNERVIVD
ncbi:hypothetical protein CXF97_19280 [Pseudomonas sp. Choline-02u-1]|jgi:hypothetical protein|uniref:hypothetical protein n=1 Tax=Pseudomonas sp. Choline-02u-1 TaxID=2058307 RepID=UPI000C32174F|nr:hypothetical protein [Pseudomonas sp. Choline-02u-1]PKH78730.1 hypothetical protein CXF97_19280 [Pseudomonas sp. Choline-02u-1]